MKRHWYDTFPFEISNLEFKQERSTKQETLEIRYGELFEEPILLGSFGLTFSHKNEFKFDLPVKQCSTIE